MWLIGRIAPDFKTIANFRKDNSKAIRGFCRQFVVLCQQLGLFGENLVACHDAGITAYVPKPMTSGAKADGRFNNDAFIYDAEKTNTSARLERR